MTKSRVVTTAAVAALAFAAAAASALAATPAAGKACTKAGAKAKAGKTILVCTKKGKKLVWAVAGAKPVAKPAPAAAGSAFNATYNGQAAVKQSGSAINILVSGVAGSGNLIGSSTLDGQGVGNSNAKPCPTFGGDGSMTAGGDKLTFHVNETSTGCADDNDQNQITIKGTANVTGGAGKFAKAKGTLGFNGTFDRQKGALSVTFTGNVSL